MNYTGVQPDHLMHPMTPPAIHVQSLTKIIGEAVILKDVTLQVGAGRIGGIIGRSGAGKTTLLRCLNGLEVPTSGDIFLFGKKSSDIKGKDRLDFQRKIGTIFQSFNLLSQRSVFDNIAFPLEIRGEKESVVRERVKSVLELVGLSHKENAYPRELSGGQNQRVAIARALVANVELLLCDEFTSALDVDTTLEILELLCDLNQRLKLTILLITHDMNVVKEICDEVFVFEAGQCVEQGNLSDILLQPNRATTKSLIGSLFKGELPHSYQTRLLKEYEKGASVILRMIFANDVARAPIIASLVEYFHIPVNIIAGHLDHVREIAFGQLIVSFPYDATLFPAIKEYLQSHHVAVHLMGYLR